MILIIIFILLIVINLSAIIMEIEMEKVKKENIYLSVFSYFYHIFSIITSFLAILYILKQ